MNKNHNERDAAWRNAYYCALALVLFALVLTFLIAITHQLTDSIIHHDDQTILHRTIHDLVPFPNAMYHILPLYYPKALKAFGQKSGFNLFYIQPTPPQPDKMGAIIPIIAPDGYGGPIHLILAVNTQLTIWGIRIMQHHETPGLGDYIEAKHPFPHRPRAWDQQFRALSLPLTEESWTITKHGGHFDAIAGASISPQAVISAIHRAMLYLKQHPEFLTIHEH